jgi:predicted transcriptional regulator
MTDAIHNFHLPLPDSLYEELKEEAKKRKRPATVVARGAIAAWLRSVRRSEVSEAIAAYATRYAGTDADLDEAFEATGIESWLNADK